ncbi:hypothetical protein GCM10009117_20460 [Gangjinia marincola]|uniref:Uncharacterized protein n=1 Tax=Gangjinia marincola TaxID=578463 RepID=A0ABN1MIM8_9FLAO
MKKVNFFALIVGAFMIVSCNSCTPGDAGDQNEIEAGEAYFELQLHQHYLTNELVRLEQELQNPDANQDEVQQQIEMNEGYLDYVSSNLNNLEKLGFVLPPLPNPCDPDPGVSICPVPRKPKKLPVIFIGQEDLIDFNVIESNEEPGGEVVEVVSPGDLGFEIDQESFGFIIEFSDSETHWLSVEKFFEPTGEMISYSVAVERM